MILQRLNIWATHIMAKRPPDVIIGSKGDPYLMRWHILPRNRLFNIYLHWFLRSDDDRALHDHPWVNLSLLIDGQYTEHMPRSVKVRHAGDLVLRGPWAAHRIELHAGVCTTLFITGPRLRVWGFHCPRGWVPWQQFVDSKDQGQIGRGCE